jgi:TatD DNase family protein
VKTSTRARTLARGGRQTIIVTGTSVGESGRAAALADAHPGQLYATAGVHPHRAS